MLSTAKRRLKTRHFQRSNERTWHSRNRQCGECGRSKIADGGGNNNAVRPETIVPLLPPLLLRQRRLRQAAVTGHTTHAATKQERKGKIPAGRGGEARSTVHGEKSLSLSLQRGAIIRGRGNDERKRKTAICRETFHRCHNSYAWFRGNERL